MWWLLYGGGVGDLENLDKEFLILGKGCDGICVKVTVWHFLKKSAKKSKSLS